jgi:NAD(P)-dependent dehydrogenase (short-subunit alcohol dehydrogenase family)
MLDLTGRHIHIVGGSRGIGAAAADFAATAGADVSFTYRSRADAAETVTAGIRARGRKALALPADAAAEGVMESALDQAVRELGPLSGMVVSAGLFEPARIEDMTLEFWNRILSVNLTATFLAVKAAARHLRAAGKGGSIVIYTSTAGQRGSDVFSAYATAKGAQILFMRSMSRELAADRIRVNCIAPSWTETDMSGGVMDAIGRAEILKGCPLGRVGLPADVAGATTFLLSDLAQFITGTTVTVDGGIDMRG